MHTYASIVSTVSALNLCNCFAVRQAARHVTKLYEHHLAGAQLTSAQFSILVALWQAGQMTMAELAGALVMDRTTLLRALKPLQREELLRSTSSTDDPRQLLFCLTSAGERKLKEAMPLWAEAQKELESQIGSRKAARLRRTLLELVNSH
jgi:DNA-binding MarR family transcriptional regulator